MDYSEAMRLCDGYLEDRAGEPVSAAELAELTGYSLYHFCHVFKAYHGVSVGEYTRKHRLNRAAGVLAGGSGILTTALDAGYDTPAGFTRAFRQQFGTTPSAYRKQIGKGERNMEPEYVKLGSFRAVGYTIRPKEGDGINAAEAGAYWRRVDFKNYPPYPNPTADQGEVAAWIHPSEKAGDLSYFFGCRSEEQTVPAGFTSLDFPAAEYAVFTVPAAANSAELADNVQKTWKTVFSEWFGGSGHAFNEGGLCFEFYKGKSAFLYVPVTKKK